MSSLAKRTQEGRGVRFAGEWDEAEKPILVDALIKTGSIIDQRAESGEALYLTAYGDDAQRLADLTGINQANAAVSPESRNNYVSLRPGEAFVALTLSQQPINGDSQRVGIGPGDIAYTEFKKLIRHDLDEIGGRHGWGEGFTVGLKTSTAWAIRPHSEWSRKRETYTPEQMKQAAIEAGLKWSERRPGPESDIINLVMVTLPKDDPHKVREFHRSQQIQKLASCSSEDGCRMTWPS